ncbi:MAG: J domain-containing protein [Anaerolineales bacterium]
MALKKDYYQILGVTPTATLAEIKQAYHQLAIQYHPDRNSDRESTVKMQEINEAYRIIGDSAKRSTYDFQLRKATGQSPTQTPTAYNIYRKNNVVTQTFFTHNESTLLGLLGSGLFLIFAFSLLIWPAVAYSLGIGSATLLLLLVNFLCLRAAFNYWRAYKAAESEFQCPNCNKPWAVGNLREELIGIYKKAKRQSFRQTFLGIQNSSGNIARYEKYKIHCQCKYCQHEWTFHKSRKQSSSIF